MSEGGLFPWKRQSITGNPADYSCLSSPLPHPPKGQAWVRNPDTREWSVVDVSETEGGDGLAVATSTLAAAVPVKQTGLLPKDCDYLQHKVEPTDTLQGICLRYGIKPVSLRQVNKFSGSNLLLAPAVLVIPLKRRHGKVTHGGYDDGSMSEERKKQYIISQFLLAIRKFQSSTTAMSAKEATAYLEMNDWNLEMAIEDAKGGFVWEIAEGDPLV